jgi:hypothetical protein
MSVGRGVSSAVSGRRESLLLYEGARKGDGVALPSTISDLTLRRADAEATFHSDQCIRETIINIFAFFALPYIYARGGCAGIRNRYFHPTMTMAWLQFIQCGAVFFLVITSIIAASTGLRFGPAPLEVTSATLLYACVG